VVQIPLKPVENEDEIIDIVVTKLIVYHFSVHELFIPLFKQNLILEMF